VSNAAEETVSDSLIAKTCKPCRGGVPPLTRAEAKVLMHETPEWELSEDASRITRTYKVGDFAAALAFVNTIGILAEDQWHHPDISFGWGYVTVALRTKKIKGLHENDFIMATKIDQAFSARI
jgi:4a-hydroxytetrahydrobiopterin dehydratase